MRAGAVATRMPHHGPLRGLRASEARGGSALARSVWVSTGGDTVVYRFSLGSLVERSERGSASREEAAMLTHQENDLLCRVEGDAPMGQLMRRHWVPAARSRSRSASPTAPPCACACSARIWSRSATPTGASACSASIARTARLRSRSGATRNAACAACITAGSSTWRAMSSRWRRSRREPLRREGQAQGVLTEEWGGFVWVYMGASEHKPDFEPPPWAPAADTKVSTVKIDIPCNWAQIMEGRSIPAHSSSLHSSDMRPARVDTAKAADTHWLRPSTDKSPKLRSSSPITASATPPSAADQQRQHACLRAHHHLCGAVHGADPRTPRTTSRP